MPTLRKRGLPRKKCLWANVYPIFDKGINPRFTDVLAV